MIAARNRTIGNILFSNQMCLPTVLMYYKICLRTETVRHRYVQPMHLPSVPYSPIKLSLAKPLLTKEELKVDSDLRKYI